RMKQKKPKVNVASVAKVVSATAGGAIGASIGLVVTGPVGTLAGGTVGSLITSVADQFTERFLAPRQKSRIEKAVELSRQRVEQMENQGSTPRKDVTAEQMNNFVEGGLLGISEAY